MDTVKTDEPQFYFDDDTTTRLHLLPSENLVGKATISLNHISFCKLPHHEVSSKNYVGFLLVDRDSFGLCRPITTSFVLRCSIAFVKVANARR